MIKNKTFVNSRSFRRDSENVETKSQRFVVDSMSFIIFAFFVTFISTFFVIIVSIFFVIVVFAFSITLSSIFASFDESIVNSMFEEMNRDVLIRFLTILISFFADLTNVSAANSISIQITISAIDYFITFVFEFIIEIDFENLNDILAKEQKRRQNLKLKMMNHEQRRVIDDFFFRIEIDARFNFFSYCFCFCFFSNFKKSSNRCEDENRRSVYRSIRYWEERERTHEWKWWRIVWLC
jgi:hypothetical protein